MKRNLNEETEYSELHDDVESLKKEILKLRKKNSELIQLFENIKEVFFSVSMPDFSLIQISSGCEKVFGHPSSDFYNDPQLWFKVIIEEDRETVRKNDALMFAGIPFEHDYRIVTGKGELRWLHTKISPALDSEGKLIRIDGLTTDIHDRKIAELKLEQSQAHLLASQHVSRVASWELNITAMEAGHQDYLIWFDESYRLIGYKPHEVPVSLEFFYRHVHSEDLRKLGIAVHKAIASNGKYHIEHRIITRKGEEKTVDCRGEVYIDSHTGERKMIGTTQDITEQKLKELKSREMKANMRTILENTDTGYILLDKDKSVLAFNKMALKILKLRGHGELKVGINYMDIISTEHISNTETLFSEVLSSGLIHNYIRKIENAGNPIWIHIKIHPVFNEKNIIGLIIDMVDITKQKINEQLLLEGNERYNLVTKATNDVIWDWDIKKNDIFHSDNFKPIFGYANELSKTSEQLLTHIHKDDQERVMNGLMEKIDSDNSDFWEDEYRYIKMNGEISYVHDRAFIVRDENKKSIRMVGAMRDITSRKIYAIEKEKVANDLIQRNKDLEQFAYIVSHNLRAPVANILGFSDALLNTEFSLEDQKEVLLGLHDAVLGIDSVTRDLNQILQVRREINELKDNISFPDLVKKVKSGFSTTIEKEKAEIKCDFSEVDHIQSLRSYLHSIFFNLISNSIKYRKRNVPVIIEVKSKDLPNSIQLIFRDNGTGIDLENKSDQVFGLYKRFHPEIEGKGLGLYMVKTQVETLGGKISIKSKKDQGTEFIIELPK